MTRPMENQSQLDFQFLLPHDVAVGDLDFEPEDAQAAIAMLQPYDSGLAALPLIDHDDEPAAAHTDWTTGGSSSLMPIPLIPEMSDHQNQQQSVTSLSQLLTKTSDLVALDSFYYPTQPVASSSAQHLHPSASSQHFQQRHSLPPNPMQLVEFDLPPSGAFIMPHASQQQFQQTTTLSQPLSNQHHQQQHDMRFPGLPDVPPLEAGSFGLYDLAQENFDPKQAPIQMAHPAGKQPSNRRMKRSASVGGGPSSGTRKNRQTVTLSERQTYVMNVDSQPLDDNEGVFVCNWPHCGREFQTFSHLRSHFRVHTAERPFKCDQCGQSFARNHDLKRHTRTHSGVKPFSCPDCNKGFARADALQRHLNRSCPASRPQRRHASTSNNRNLNNDDDSTDDYADVSLLHTIPNMALPTMVHHNNGLDI